jgi:hypothetical protein
MSGVIAAPSLSTLGWVTDPVNKFDLVLSWFFLSDYNQTYLYKEYVTSLPRIIEKNGGDIQGVLADLRTSLSDYLKRYYDNVKVEASVGNNASDFTGKIQVNLNIGIGDNGTQKVYGRILKSTNSRLESIAKINNG